MIIKINEVPNKKYAEMLNSVVGQLSDGIWENSGRATGYWKYSNGSVDGTTIETEDCYGGGRNWYGYWERQPLNPYYNMTKAQILRYYANKIKQIALIELEDNGKEKKFVPSNIALVYLRYNEDITMADAVELYKLLMTKAKEMEKGA